MTEYEKIIQKTGNEPSECSCGNCRKMCERSPCLGTPSDILRLINNGHILKLDTIRWGVGARYFNLPIIHMVQPLRPDGIGCAFYENGLCSLHESGLKPTEGKLASCKLKNAKLLPELGLAVAQTWEDPANTKTITLIAKAIIKMQ